MTTKIITLVLSLTTASASPLAQARDAASETAGGCCAVAAKPAPAACCSDIASVVPLSSRSLYQFDAAWTDDAGERLQLAALRGKPVVLAMFFAGCTYACPMLVTDMQRIRQALPEPMRKETRFVLVTFDTERDTPAALKAFRERSALDADWVLLQGNADSVQELAMLLGVKFKQDTAGQFAHSNVVTVLNAEGEIAHQRNGLAGDVSETAQAVILAAR